MQAFLLGSRQKHAGMTPWDYGTLFWGACGTGYAGMHLILESSRFRKAAGAMAPSHPFDYRSPTMA